MSKRTLALGLFSCHLGCTHAIHQNHASDYHSTQPLSAHKQIRAHTEQKVFLGFVKQTDYADRAIEKLMEQCVGGTITGIQSRYSTSHNFFTWRNVLDLKGYCIQ